MSGSNTKSPSGAGGVTPLLPTRDAFIGQLHTAVVDSGEFSFDRVSLVDANDLLFGRGGIVKGAQSLAAQAFRLIGPAAPKSSVQAVTVGNPPAGYGKVVNWAHNDRALALVIYLNPADAMGVGIQGVEAGDSIQFVAATGIASFKSGTENSGMPSLVGIVGAGADLTATAFGHPEVKPLIDAGEKWAQAMLPSSLVLDLPRDPFGRDPGTGKEAQQEGGVIISMPTGRTVQICTSGDHQHPDRWVQWPGARVPANYPAHVTKAGAWFLEPDAMNMAVAVANGEILIYPWDWKFGDNTGFYRLDVLLRR